MYMPTCLSARLSARVVSFSHGLDAGLGRLSVRGAIVSRMLVQVELKRPTISLALILQDSCSVGSTELLKAAEN